MKSPGRMRVEMEEPRHALRQRRYVGEKATEQRGRPRFVERAPAREPSPECLQLLEPVLDGIAGDDGAVDRADRRADHPVRHDAAFTESFVDAGLIGTERAPTLKHEHD